VRFACRHSLLQEVAYGGLTRMRRRALHAQIAVAMERLAGDRAGEEAAVLARHARLGEAWGAALRHARVAGARAASHSANREAVRFYEEALEALTHQPADAAALSLGVDLRFSLRDPLFRLGHITSLRNRLDEAATLAEKLGDMGRLGQLCIFQSHHAWLAGDYTATIAASGRASALAETQKDAALALRAVFERALGEFGQGALAASAAGMAQVAEWAEDKAIGGRFGLDAALAVVALGYQTRALTDLRQFEAADRVAKACATRAAEVSRPFTSIFAAVAEGYLLLARGAASEAITRLAPAVALCDQAEADLMRPVAQSFLGAAEVASGLITTGLERLELAVKTAAAMGFLFQQPLRLALLAEALSAAGRTEEAAQRAAEALALAASHGEKILLLSTLRAAARIG
jgi:tetratricopeptide (TPR) repeat protein